MKDPRPSNPNNTRARRGLKTLQAYKQISGSGYAMESVDTALIDVLTDLMHWGSRIRRHSSLDKFESALAMARVHFVAEEAEARPPGSIDYVSSASRQHFVDTGRYLKVGEAIEA
jgi:hypothetical protein